jgi:hypothetical protein
MLGLNHADGPQPPHLTCLTPKQLVLISFKDHVAGTSESAHLLDGCERFILGSAGTSNTPSLLDDLGRLKQ